MSETRTDVIISGGGPNGLMLACELALGGVQPIVLESLPAPSDQPKANGLVGQVVRLIDMRGLYRPAENDMLGGASGDVPQPIPTYIFSGLPLELTTLQPNPMYGLPIPQPRLVERLAHRAEELAVGIRWGHALTDFRTEGEWIIATVNGPDGPDEIITRYLVGADGGKSLVRKRSGIEFHGSSDNRRTTWFGHAQIPDELRNPEGGIDIPGVGHFGFGHTRVERGMFVYAEFAPGRGMIGTTEYDVDPISDDIPVTFDELRESVERVLGVPVPMEPPQGPGPHALRRTVGQNTLQAEHYRAGNVLLVGDAAHVHSAMGGPGLNLGMQDAINLGWKLAAVVRGDVPADLLDTYESERYPVGERVMMHSLAQSAMMTPGPEITALRQLFGELLHLPEVAAHIANLLAGSDVRYDTGDPHPLSGHLVPEFTVHTPDGPRRIAELLRPARPILLDFTGSTAAHAEKWSDRVDIITATTPDAPATALLIRPDGYIAWAATESDTDPDGLRQALTRWFGPARELAEARA